MNNEKYLLISGLEKDGKAKEAFELLLSLAGEGHPLAMFDLSSRYYSIEGCWPEPYPVEPDLEKSRVLAASGKLALERLAGAGNGEAMRMLGYYYLGHLAPCDRDMDEAELWLLRAFEAGCFVAANDLHTFYLGSDQEKSKHWYDQAEKHKCRLVYNANFER